MPRFEPYTATGIKRVPCARCGKPGHASWNICADKVGERTQFRALCVGCDIGMNEVAMRYVFGKAREADLERYAAKLKPVTKEATITTKEAVKAVRSYLREPDWYDCMGIEDHGGTL